jgi:hypothetical protein
VEKMTHGPTLPREQSTNMALAQIGWLGQTGGIYHLGAAPSKDQEPGGYSPLYLSVGVWEDLGEGHYGIKD